MAIQKVFKLHSVRYVSSAPNPVVDITIPAMQSAEATTETDIEREILPGSIYAKSATVRIRRVGVTFDTKDIRSALNALSLGGLCFEGGNPQVTLYFAQYDCSKIMAGSVHLQYVMNRGVLFPRSLSANHQADASIGYGIAAVFDGVNAPFIKTSDVALPAAVDSGERWAMYKTNIESIEAIGKTRFGIEWNAQVQTQGADDDAFDSVAMLTGVTPEVTLGGVNPEWFSDGVVGATGLQVPLEGKTITHANSSIVLKKRNVAVGVAEHIILRFGGPAYFPTPVAGSGTELATSELKVSPIEVGVNTPVTYELDQATT